MTSLQVADESARNGGSGSDDDRPHVLLVLGEETCIAPAVARLLPPGSLRDYEMISRPGITLALKKSGAVRPRLVSGTEDAVVLLGHLVHETEAAEQALPDALAALSSGELSSLAKLQGIFVVLRVNWAQRQIQIVTDLLGIRPFYICRHQRMVVLSDRAETCARWNGPRIDPVAFGAYLMLRTALADRSLYEGVERIAAGSVTWITGDESRARPYWIPPVDDRPISEAELGASFRQEFRQSVTRMLAPYERATVLLSGGFDSRLILLTALGLKRLKLDCATVAYNDSEDSLARQVAADAGVRCRSVTIRGSLWDAFPHLWHHHPDGYPISRNLTYLAVTGTDFGGPYLDGSMEGAVFRCPAAKPTDQPPKSLNEAYERVWARRQPAPELLFRPEPLRRHIDAARAAMQEQGDRIGWQQKFPILWHIYTHDRRYVSNNFLQYQDLKTSLQPFYDRALLERRLCHQDTAFSKEAYRRMLTTYFPRPGGHPHSSDAAQQRDTIRTFCRALWRELPELTRFALRYPQALRLPWILPRLSYYAIGGRSQLYVAMTLARLREFERMVGPELTGKALAGAGR
ncbi:MAG: asparagine synthase-related protein [Pirellulaceae bacterium]